MIRRLLLATLFLPLTAFAVDDLDQWLEQGMDQETLRQISLEAQELFPDGQTQTEQLQVDPDQIDLNPIRRFYDQVEEYSDTRRFPDPPELKFRRQDEIPPYQAVLKRDSVITRLSDRESFRVPDTIYVRAQEQFPGSRYSVLLDREGEPKFYTETRALVSIDKIVNLSTGIDATVTYEKPSRARTTDKSFPLETNVSLFQDLVSAEALGQFHPMEDASGNAQRFQVQSFTRSPLPFDIGLTLSFFSGTLGKEEFGDTISFQGLSIGPIIKRKFYERESSYLELHLRAEHVMGFKSEDPARTNTYQSLQWGLGAEWTMETFLGPFYVGADYRIQTLSLKSSSDETLRAPVEKDSIRSLGLGLGYRWRVEL